MRYLLAVSAAVLALAVPVAAHADTLVTFTDGGTSYSFTLPTTPSYINVAPAPGFYDYAAFYVTLPGGDSGDFLFYAADDTAFYNGSFDLEFFDFSQTPTVDILLNGPTLYAAGTTAAPVFLPGNYSLTDSAGDKFGLVIGATGAAPEPSSLILLGTGVLSLAGAARRKLRKA